MNPKTGFARESGRKQTFSSIPGLKPCTSHVVVFGCLGGQDVVRSFEKSSTKDAQYQDYSVSLPLSYQVVERHCSSKLPKTFESKLDLFWLKEPLIKLQN